jgi:hypothetical protein
MNKAPDKIYLQACGDCPEVDLCQSCKFDDLEEVTWAYERVWEKDIEYIRKDALLKWAEAKHMELDPPQNERDFGRIEAVEELIDKINSL